MPKATTKKTTEAPLTTEQKVAKTYAVAIQQLKANHLDEFNKLRIAAAIMLGVTWKPQPTAEQKAEAEIRKLVADNPGLAERYPNLFEVTAETEEDNTEPDDAGDEPEPDTEG